MCSGFRSGKMLVDWAMQECTKGSRGVYSNSSRSRKEGEQSVQKRRRKQEKRRKQRRELPPLTVCLALLLLCCFHCWLIHGAGLCGLTLIFFPGACLSKMPSNAIGYEVDESRLIRSWLSVKDEHIRQFKAGIACTVLVTTKDEHIRQFKAATAGKLNTKDEHIRQFKAAIVGTVLVNTKDEHIRQFKAAIAGTVLVNAKDEHIRQFCQPLLVQFWLTLKMNTYGSLKHRLPVQFWLTLKMKRIFLRREHFSGRLFYTQWYLASSLVNFRLYIPGIAAAILHIFFKFVAALFDFYFIRNGKLF
ncbi:hypothetical protein ElyMa_006782900 [Elysia marginata]|uniref:Uncharacterized protein n=1 Tax=Elysia marginata TaxID=1093978 RepID=A0AAV4IZS5_9GAST|nr:hypothetical protein ElyMa_006782900 [Elysia marginata]